MGAGSQESAGPGVSVQAEQGQGVVLPFVFWQLLTKALFLSLWLKVGALYNKNIV